jgi:hypothetical protein
MGKEYMEKVEELKGMKERKTECVECRYERNHCPSYFNGLVAISLL